MSDNIIILMLGISTFLGALGLWALLWGLKSGQFNDQSKFLDTARFDSEEDYRDAVMMEQKKKDAIKRKRKKEKEKEKEKNYMPND